MKKEDSTEPVFCESINKALSRRGFIHGVGGIGALLGLTAKAIGAEAPRDADGNIIPGFEKIKEESESFDEESPAQKFDQEFALMTLQLSAFFKSLFEAFGGLEDPSHKLLPDNRNKEE